MLFRMLYDDKLAQASYFIGCQKTGEAIVIDPERDIQRYLSLAEKEGMEIVAIAETHIHADFLSGARELAENTDACLYLSDEGDENWKYLWLNKKQQGTSYKHKLLKDKDVFKIGNIEFKVVHTPGHTPEHICFMVTDLGGGATEPMGIATGDFVFVGDVGRPDLLESAAGQEGAKEPAAKLLYQSLQKFVELPDYLQLWPGHGAGSACGKALGAVPQSTVGYEKRFNGAVSLANDETKFISAILHGQPEPPMYFARMKKENKEGPRILGKLPQPAVVEVSLLQQLPEDAVILDTRLWQNFQKGHIANSIHAPLDNSFPTVAGSYVTPESPIFLVIESEKVQEAVVDLIRIGLDNITGYVEPQALQNCEDLQETISYDIADVPEEMTKDAVILDVRKSSEYEEGHIDNALNIAHTRLAVRLSEVPQTTVLVHCRTGVRATFAASFLQSKGYNVVHLSGSYKNWPHMSESS